MPASDETKRHCSDWKAIHNFMPPAPPKLRVDGKCTFDRPGYRVILKKHIPQGIVPDPLLLDIEIKPPVDPQHGGNTTVEAAYEEQTDFHYQEVVILPDQIKIKVEDVY